MQSHSYLNINLHCFIFRFYHIPTKSFNFEVTPFVVETSIIVNTVSQVVMFILILLYQFLHINTTIHDNTIGYYCYYCHYFSICEL